MVNRNYISENRGRFCGEYGIATLDTNREDGGIIVVYKVKEYNDYEKLFTTKELGGSFFGSIVANDENIYFIYLQNGSGLSINAYDLNTGDEFNAKVETNDIYEIYKAYGIKDNFIYLQYTKYTIIDDDSVIGPTRKEAIDRSYGRISFDLKNFEEIKESDIPTNFDYPSC